MVSVDLQSLAGVDLGDIILDEFPPEVISVSPVDGASMVSLGELIVVTFSEPIRPAR